MTMSEHEKTRKNLQALVAGLLSAEEERAASAHLAHCAECSRQVEIWRRLAGSLERLPEVAPAPARLARIAALARARRQEVMETRWNRLVLTGLVICGWMCFLIPLPLAPTVLRWVGGWLGLPSLVAGVLLLGSWWLFGWSIGMGLLPLLRARGQGWRERVI
jgi:anti-sigma factor RsiW